MRKSVSYLNPQTVLLKNIMRGARAHKFRALEKRAVYLFQSEHCLEYSIPVFASSFFIHGQERHGNLIIAGQTVKAALMKCFKSPGLKRMYRVRNHLSSQQAKRAHTDLVCFASALPIYYKNDSHILP